MDELFVLMPDVAFKFSWGILNAELDGQKLFAQAYKVKMRGNSGLSLKLPSPKAPLLVVHHQLHGLQEYTSAEASLVCRLSTQASISIWEHP